MPTRRRMAAGRCSGSLFRNVGGIILVPAPQRAVAGHREDLRMSDQPVLDIATSAFWYVGVACSAKGPRSHPDGRDVLQLSLDRPWLASSCGDHAAAVLRLIGLPSCRLFRRHREIAADQHGALIRRPVSAFLAWIDANCSHDVSWPAETVLGQPSRATRATVDRLAKIRPRA